MDKVPVCIVGCGGMGHRHILGYKALADTGIGNLDIVAVCDVRPENAALAAREVERLLGTKPMIFADPEQAVAHPEIAAFDVVTDASVHHRVAVPALMAGKHALVEKPLGATIRACQAMIAAAHQGGAVLATAENFRRDPPNRQSRSIIEHGLLGAPYLMIETVLGRDDLIDTPWRHVKESGSLALDSFVHHADIAQYYLGRIDQVFGKGLIVEPVRRRPDRFDHHLEYYRERFKGFPEKIVATAEDAVLAMFKMESGAVVQFSGVAAGRGARVHERSVHGRLGSMHPQGDRVGRPVILRLEDRELTGREILPLLPDFRLNEVTERLYGSQAVEYTLPRPECDARNIALELHDFAEAIIDGRAPEVDGHQGMAAVAAVLGAFESEQAGRPVSMDEILAGDVRAYQADIDEALDLN